MATWLYGQHPVLEAMRGDNREVLEVRLAEGAGPSAIGVVREEAELRGIPARTVGRDDLAGLDVPAGARVVARCGPFSYRTERDLPACAPGENSLCVVLDRVQDPQNLGAILRTADAAGAVAICLPRRHAAGITAAVVRASAGASEHLAIHRVANVARTLARLADLGYWTIGLDPTASEAWCDVDYRGGVALVVGAEGAGLRRLVGEACDRRVALPMRGGVASMNVAATFAAAVFEVVRQHRDGGASAE